MTSVSHDRRGKRTLTPMELRNERLAPLVVAKLQNRGFDACYARTREEGLKQALAWIPEGATVGWGGSISVSELGLREAVRSTHPVIDRDEEKTEEGRQEKMRQALLSDVFLTGSNAVSEDGRLINMDGNGNRVAALTFGPKMVIVVAGMNKVDRSVEAGLERIRTIAAPVNMMRFLKEDSKTGCSKTGSCQDCNAPDCICNHLVITRRCRPVGRIKVLLVGEDLGI